MLRLPVLENHVARAALVVLAAATVVALLHGSVEQVAFLYPNSLPANPRFVLEKAAQLYLVVPLVVVAAVVVLLAPGAMFVLLVGGGREKLTHVLLKAFAAGLGLRFVIHSIWKVAGFAVTPKAFAALELVAVGGLALALWIQSRRSGPLTIAWAGAPDAWRLVRLLTVLFVLVAACIPEIFWKDLIGDGYETLYSGFSLSEHIVTRFATDSGFYGLGAGLLSQGYPVSWFGNLFGFAEHAARLPMALYAMLISAGIIALVECQVPRRLRAGEELAVMLGVAAFAATLGFNSSYYSYAADFAAPLTEDSLTLVCVVGLLTMLWSGEFAWFLGFVIVGNFNRPNVLVVLGFLLLATVVVRGEGWRRQAAFVALAAATCLMLNFVYEKVYLARVTTLPIEGLGSGHMLRRVQYLQFTDIRRLLYLLVPSGMLPALALLAYRSQDALARQITILTLLYFSFFYVEAYYSLHHFAPIMVLPLIVLWRLRAARPPSRWFTSAAAAGAAASLMLAFPWGKPIARQTHSLANQFDVRVAGPRRSIVWASQTVDRRAALAGIFPPQWKVADLQRTWGLDTGMLIYYTHRAPDLGSDSINYRVQDRSEPAPAGWQQVVSAGPLVGFVRDTALWQQQLAHPPATDFASPIYRIRREQLITNLGVAQSLHQIDLSKQRGLWRLFR